MTKLGVVSLTSYPAVSSFSIYPLNAEERSWPRHHGNVNFRTSKSGKTFLLERPLTSFIFSFSFFSLFFAIWKIRPGRPSKFTLAE